MKNKKKSSNANIVFFILIQFFICKKYSMINGRKNFSNDVCSKSF